MEHTKLPWKVDWTFPTRQSPCRILGDGEIVRVTFRGKGADGSAEANAAFIVHCCNAHDELVRTLRAIRARIDGEWDNPALMEYGPLTSVTEDIPRIVRATLRRMGESE